MIEFEFEKFYGVIYEKKIDLNELFRKKRRKKEASAAPQGEIEVKQEAETEAGDESC